MHILALLLCSVLGASLKEDSLGGCQDDCDRIESDAFLESLRRRILTMGGDWAYAKSALLQAVRFYPTEGYQQMQLKLLDPHTPRDMLDWNCQLLCRSASSEKCQRTCERLRFDREGLITVKPGLDAPIPIYRQGVFGAYMMRLFAHQCPFLVEPSKQVALLGAASALEAIQRLRLLSRLYDFVRLSPRDIAILGLFDKQPFSEQAIFDAFEEDADSRDNLKLPALIRESISVRHLYNQTQRKYYAAMERAMHAYHVRRFLSSTSIDPHIYGIVRDVRQKRPGALARLPDSLEFSNEPYILARLQATLERLDASEKALFEHDRIPSLTAINYYAHATSRSIEREHSLVRDALPLSTNLALAHVRLIQQHMHASFLDMSAIPYGILIEDAEISRFIESNRVPADATRSPADVVKEICLSTRLIQSIHELSTAFEQAVDDVAAVFRSSVVRFTVRVPDRKRLISRDERPIRQLQVCTVPADPTRSVTVHLSTCSDDGTIRLWISDHANNLPRLAATLEEYVAANSKKPLKVQHLVAYIVQYCLFLVPHG